MNPPAANNGPGLVERVAAFECQLLTEAIQRHSTKGDAARALKISPSQLTRKMQRHGLAERFRDPRWNHRRSLRRAYWAEVPGLEAPSRHTARRGPNLGFWFEGAPSTGTWEQSLGVEFGKLPAEIRNALPLRTVKITKDDSDSQELRKIFPTSRGFEIRRGM